jgi:hypothetical protein
MIEDAINQIAGIMNTFPENQERINGFQNNLDF